MKKDEWNEALLQVKNIAILLRYTPDFKEFIEANKLASEIAPYTDPTAWMRGNDNLEDWTKIAQAVKEAKDKIEDVFVKATQRGASKEKPLEALKVG
jgi:hypothetical protein